MDSLILNNAEDFKNFIHHSNFEKIPTLVPFPYFDPRQDVTVIHEYISMSRRDGKLSPAALKLLTQRSCQQRNEIKDEYNNVYKEYLPTTLSSKSSHSPLMTHFLTSIFHSTSYDYLATDLHFILTKSAKSSFKLLSHHGSLHEYVSEILCSRRTNSKILGITLSYQELFQISLTHDINSNTHFSEDYKELLSSIIKGARNEKSNSINVDKARRRAESLHAAVSSNYSTSQKIFLRLLTHESYPQLNCIFAQFEQLSCMTIEEGIRKCASDSSWKDDFKHGCLSIVQSTHSKPLFYATLLHSSLHESHSHTNFFSKSLDTGISQIIRTIILRSEIDLESIRREYARVFHKSLLGGVMRSFSGDHDLRDCLLGMLGWQEEDNVDRGAGKSSSNTSFDDQ